MGSEFKIAVLPGDGIGVEVMEACISVLKVLEPRFGLRFNTEHVPGGAMLYSESGNAFPDSSMQLCRQADAVLFGAMGWPNIRYPDGTEIAPQLDLRFELDLFAGVRPIRAIPGVPLPLAAPEAASLDFVIVRESTEGWFNARGNGIKLTTPEGAEAVQDTCQITRPACERLFDFAFALARRRKEQGISKGKVTCVDKSSVYLGMAFMNQIFHECAARHPDIASDHNNVDAYCLNLVRKPWTFDVCPMENQFGDITSDLGAGLIGGLGYAPSADVGFKHAVFQPSHGSAPDIAGQGVANPTAMILSAAMMLDWLAEQHQQKDLSAAACAIVQAVDDVFAHAVVRPGDIGGSDGTEAVARAVIDKLQA